MQTSFYRPIKQVGFSMFEVLVSVIILAFGILGVIGLQTAAYQSNREARLQAIATTYATEIADAVRANKSTALSSATATNAYLVDYSYSPSTTPSFPLFTINCYTANCTRPEDLAKWDIAQILKRIHQDLPYARIRTCLDDSPYDSSGKAVWTCSNSGDMLTIKIGWSARDFKTGKVIIEQDDSVIPKIVFSVRPGSS
jgi:type IV pilus assembly protein PilV